jgi:hypothetical protein
VYTYQLQPRVMRKESGELPTFPCRAEITIELEPAHAFGEGSGSLPIILMGSSLETLYNANTGRHQNSQNPPLGLVKLELEILGGTARLSGKNLIFRYECPSFNDLASRIETLRLVLPAIFSLYAALPVTAASATGQAETLRVRSQIARSASPLLVTTQSGYEDRIKNALASVELLLEERNATLLAAIQYFHVAQRLLVAGESPDEFSAEVLLNCTKALEVLFGNRDATRAGAQALGYSTTEIEGTFVALQILRDELDVGHAKIATYPDDVLDRIYSFVGQIPSAIEELLVRAINATTAGTSTPRVTRPDLPERDKKGIAELLGFMETGLKERQERLLPPKKLTSQSEAAT